MNRSESDWSPKRGKALWIGDGVSGGPGGLSVILGTAPAEEARDEYTAELIARWLAYAKARDYWVLLYDGRGGKRLDAVMRAKLIELDAHGKLRAHGDAGEPAARVFVPVELHEEDRLPFARAMVEGDVQIVWKELPSGSFQPDRRPRSRAGYAPPHDSRAGIVALTIAVVLLVLMVLLAI